MADREASDDSIDEGLIVGEDGESDEVPKLGEGGAAPTSTKRRRLARGREDRRDEADGPDDAGKDDRPEDEYRVEDDRPEDEGEHDLPQESAYPHEHPNQHPSSRRPKGKKGEVSDNILHQECEELVNEMNFASDSDITNNKNGRPGIAKLKMMDKIIGKLKSMQFASAFLDKDGLNVLNKFISKLPDGSWPLSNVRNQILKLIYSLPATMDHLKMTDLGRTLNLLQSSPKELTENKKLIQTIKDKWSRIICQIPVEYADLEHCEAAYNSVPLTLRQQQDDEEYLGKRKTQSEEELNQNLSYRMIRPGAMGYNFSVRPNSAYNEKNYIQRPESQVEFDRYLMRIKRGNKKN